MTLCLDIGNSQIYGGVFKNGSLALQFRRESKSSSSSDEIGVFLRSVLRENLISPNDVRHISICTVVPEVLHSVRNACWKYFNITPFVLQAGAKTGLNIRYRDPIELGADRIANAIAVTHIFKNENIILVDMGTATTFCAISSKKDFLGGAIVPGIKISMSSLETNTSKLPTVEIIQTKKCLGRSTVEGIQSGLYFGTLGSMKEIIDQLKKEAFQNKPTRVVGTGGFASLFSSQNIFDKEISDLILQGLYLAHKLNSNKTKRISKDVTHPAEMQTP